MPFDFTKVKPYTIDYSDLEKTLLSLDPYFSDRALQEQHISCWIVQLKELDNSIVRAMNSHEAISQYVQSRRIEPEVFQVPIVLGKNTFQIAFRITPLLKSLSKAHNAHYYKIPTSEFIGNTKINWSQESTLGKMPLKVPIIIVPFPIGKYTELVIDGNHRISEHIKNGSKDIPAYTISGKSLIDNNLFSCAFDKFLYAMLLEMQCAKECFESGMSDNDIFSQSMLHFGDGYFHYSERGL